MKLLSTSKLASAGLAAALATFFVLSSFATADAHYRRYRHNHRSGAGVAAGIIAGAIIGGAIIAGSRSSRQVRRHRHRHTHYNRRGRVIKRHRHRHNRRHHR